MHQQEFRPKDHQDGSARGGELLASLHTTSFPASSNSLAPTAKAVAAWLGIMAVWSAVTSQPSSAPDHAAFGPLPEEIPVTTTSLPTHTRETLVERTLADGTVMQETKTIRFVKTSEIDFSNDFYLETPRYRFVKHDDFPLSQVIGHVFSVLGKAALFDYRVGLGLDGEGSKSVLSFLENSPEIKGVTVRINHNQVFEDAGRALTDPLAEQRNPWAARFFYGVPKSFAGELLAEIRRGDYYNPMTNTVVLYSNIPAVYTHELGHHMDFKRFPSDWEYAIARSHPPTMLYQEAKASLNAQNELLPKSLSWQGPRYLLPAFATYCVGFVLASRKLLARGASRRYRASESRGDELVSGPQVVRHMAQGLGSFTAGHAAFTAVAASGAPFLAAGAAFVGATIATWWALNKLLKEVVPYEHE